jgi:hypothetical protein
MAGTYDSIITDTTATKEAPTHEIVTGRISFVDEVPRPLQWTTGVRPGMIAAILSHKGNMWRGGSTGWGTGRSKRPLETHGISRTQPKD